MQQLTQQLKSGYMEIMEVPFPALGRGEVMVRNHYSVISAGTEGKTVSDARKGYIAKAKSRQKELQQVFDMIKTTGIAETYKTVMNKLEAPSPLGYSCAGEVIAVGDGVLSVRAGDFVACGGQGAWHAEVVAVPEKLCVKVPEGVELKHAAFTTIAAIALQGVRQSELKLGENCVVIGLGIIGLLTIQMLRAAGVQVTGIDIDPGAVAAARENGANLAIERNAEGLEKMVQNFSGGFGTDAVIITAATSSNDPVELAGALCRQKGKVVIVGAVPTGFSRTPYYKKELDLRMSSSYGPGRYDPVYEEKNIDYPIGYVRWTENRNMQAYIEMLKSGSLEVEKLISHIFPLEKAAEAYGMILEKKERFSGILIKYDAEREEPVKIRNNQEGMVSSPDVNIGIIGAGAFAQNVLLPRLKGLGRMVGVASGKGIESKYVAGKYGFDYSAANGDELMQDPAINTVFVLTRHNLHAAYVIKALKSGKNVFVEKPLAMNEQELEEVRMVYESGNSRLMLGFNRRFSPFVQKLKSIFADGEAKSVLIRVNAGVVPKEHWVHDPELGGGRIIGEACHFIDLAMYLAGAEIVSVFAVGIPDAQGLNDSVAVNLTFGNGSIASVVYVSNGNKQVPKEMIEVFCNGTVARIDDFRSLKVFGNKNISMKGKQDKGHKNELVEFTDAIRNGKPAPIGFDEIYLSTKATFGVLQSIRERRVIELGKR
jgi:polar amino acid transport system substrate-binding protein